MRIVVLFIFGLFLSACQGTNPYGLTTASLGETVVSSASGQAGTGVTPIKGIKYVSLHPDRLLRDERSCTEIIKLSYAFFSSSIVFANFMINWIFSELILFDIPDINSKNEAWFNLLEFKPYKGITNPRVLVFREAKLLALGLGE